MRTGAPTTPKIKERLLHFHKFGVGWVGPESNESSDGTCILRLQACAHCKQGPADWRFGKVSTAHLLLAQY